MSEDNGSDESDSLVLADLILDEKARRPGVSLDDDHDQDEAPDGEIDDTIAPDPPAAAVEEYIAEATPPTSTSGRSSKKRVVATTSRSSAQKERKKEEKSFCAVSKRCPCKSEEESSLSCAFARGSKRETSRIRQ